MRKSKKRSDSNSRLPPEPTHFLGRSQSKHIIAIRLCYNDMAIEMHDNHLPAAVPGADWIALFVQRGWITVTNRHARCRSSLDQGNRRRQCPSHCDSDKNATGSDIADLLAHRAASNREIQRRELRAIRCRNSKERFCQHVQDRSSVAIILSCGRSCFEPFATAFSA